MSEIKLSPAERETIILFNESDQSAECYTHSRRLINRLQKICETRSDEAQLIGDNGFGGLTFTCPKSWIKVNPKRILDDAQRVAIVQRFTSNSGSSSEV